MPGSRNPKTRPQLVDSPLAITTEGQVLANVTHVLAEADQDPQELLTQALAKGRQVFMGVVLTEAEVRDTKQRMDDAAAEIVAMVVRL